MKKFFRLFGAVGLLAGMLMAAGCGDDDNTTSSTTTTTGVAKMTGKLVQGPVKDGVVFADQLVNGKNDLVMSANETNGTTNATGDYSINAPSYSYVLVSKGGTDTITGQKAIQMIAQAGSKNVTPITTLVALDATGAVKTKLEAMMPAGSKYDADISTGASQAVLLVAKSVEAIVESITTAVTNKAGTGVTISAAQMAAVQGQALQAISAEIAKPATTAATLAVPALLTTTLGNAATTAATAITNYNPNISLPAAAVSAIATSSVASATTALAVPVAGATTTVVTEATAIPAARATAFQTAIAATVATAVTALPAVTATPTAYVAPVIAVVTTQPATGSTGTGTVN